MEAVMLVIKYTPEIFLTASVHFCDHSSHPSEIFATLKWVWWEIESNYSYVWLVRHVSYKMHNCHFSYKSLRLFLLHAVTPFPFQQYICKVKVDMIKNWKQLFLSVT